MRALAQLTKETLNDRDKAKEILRKKMEEEYAEFEKRESE